MIARRPAGSRVRAGLLGLAALTAGSLLPGEAMAVAPAFVQQASLGIAVLEYAGLSTVNNATAVDQLKTATGTTTTTAATITSGPTPALTTDDALVFGLYADSGFNTALTAGPAYTRRLNTSTSAISQRLAQDRILATGATPAASARTGPRTTWLIATIALKRAPS